MASLKRTERRRQFFKSFEARSLRSRSFLTQIADDLTAICGSTPFLIFHILFFASWIFVNLGYLPGIEIFDPYPFGLLTMTVSLEAIFLSIFVLVSQNRSSYISTIRDEVHIGLNSIAEEEITKILEVLADIRKELGIKKPDPQLEKMLERLDTGYIEKSILGQMERANKSLVKKMLEELPEPIAHPKSIIINTNGSGDNSAPANGNKGSSNPDKKEEKQYTSIL
jgi:uncharacterized membrane protein